MTSFIKQACEWASEKFQWATATIDKHSTEIVTVVTAGVFLPLLASTYSNSTANFYEQNRTSLTLGCLAIAGAVLWCLNQSPPASSPTPTSSSASSQPAVTSPTPPIPSTQTVSVPVFIQKPTPIHSDSTVQAKIDEMYPELQKYQEEYEENGKATEHNYANFDTFGDRTALGCKQKWKGKVQDYLQKKKSNKSEKDLQLIKDQFEHLFKAYVFELAEMAAYGTPPTSYRPDMFS
jgi:hypothetical protein